MKECPCGQKFVGRGDLCGSCRAEEFRHADTLTQTVSRPAVPLVKEAIVCPVCEARKAANRKRQARYRREQKRKQEAAHA